jgi:hypothetical protein
MPEQQNETANRRWWMQIGQSCIAYVGSRQAVAEGWDYASLRDNLAFRGYDIKTFDRVPFTVAVIA